MIFFEYHSQIDSLTVSFPSKCCAAPVIRINHNRIIVQINEEEHDIRLPVKVESKSARISSQDGWQTIQLKALSVQEFTVEPKRTFSPDLFNCHSCKANIVAMQIERTLALPTEFWFEMSECWACHNEDYTKLPGQVGGLIYAQKNALMVANSYYMIHPENVTNNSVELKFTGREVSETAGTRESANQKWLTLIQCSDIKGGS